MPTPDEAKYLLRQTEHVCGKQLRHLVAYPDGSLGVETYGYCKQDATAPHICPYNNFDKHNKTLCSCCANCQTTCAAASGAE